MVNFRKLAKFALTGSLAFGLVMAAGTMKAEAKPKMQIDYEKQCLTIKDTGSNASDYIYIGIENNGKIKTWDRIQITSQDKSVKVDISNFSTAKDITLQAYADKDLKADDTPDTEKITINKIGKKVVAKYAPSAVAGSKIEFTIDGGKVDAKDLQFRTAATAWQDVIQQVSGNNVNMIETNLDYYSLYGATLIIRRKPVNDNPSASPAVVGYSASKEAKLKIPKKANGPKAVVDPVKLQVTIPAKSEWRIIGDTALSGTVSTAANVNKKIWTLNSATDTEGWIKADSKLVLTDKVFKETINAANLLNGKKPSLWSGATIEVRKAATEKAAASKISFVDLGDQGDEPDITAGSEEITWKYYADAKNLKVMGLEITNKKDKAMQVAIVDSNTDITTVDKINEIDLTNVKFTTVKANGTAKIPVKTAAKDKVLIFRYAGVKATKDKPMTIASKLNASKYTYPTPATADLNASLAAKTDNEGKSVLTAPTNSGQLEYGYATSSTNITSLPLEKKADGVTKLTAATTDISTSAGQYIVVYEYDKDTKIISKFKCIKVTNDLIGKAPASN